jgi:dipeptidase E
VSSGAVPLERRLVFASGGHEFSRRRGNEALRDYVLGLGGRENPRVCLLPTASGDAEGQIAAFRRSLGGLRCIPSQISLFRLEAEPVAVREHLLEQDILYVGGGSMLNLLAIWRAHKLDRVLRECWERGIVLTGQSAGAMCWFEFGVTLSAGAPTVAQGLGLLPGSLCVHYHGNSPRRRAFQRVVAVGVPPGYGVDDQAGLLFRGRELAEVVSGRPGAGAWRVEADGHGGCTEKALERRELADPRPPIDEPTASIRELRELTALRQGARFARR